MDLDLGDSFGQSLVIFAELSLTGMCFHRVDFWQSLFVWPVCNYFFTTSRPFGMLLGPLLHFLPSSN